jgi:hypothetical protein
MGTITGYVVGSCLFENAESASVSVWGDSMNPLLEDGQKISLKPLEKEARLVSGNLYAFKHGAKLVLHRFVCNRKGRSVFVGDNRTIPELVERNDVVARYEIRQDPILRLIVTVVSIAAFSSPCLKKPLFALKRKIASLLGGLHEEKV